MATCEIRTELVPANGQTFEVLTCGSGDTLALCLHGFPEVALSWRDNMPTLAALGYRVWAPNQRGYGASSRPTQVQDYAIEHLMADVAGLIDASGAKRVVLLGHDWGAIVAWCFAVRRIRPLEALVIINVPHPARFAQSLRRPGQMLRSWYAMLFQIPWLPERLLGRNGAAAVPKSMLRTSTAPDAFPRDLLEATRANAAQHGALRAMIHWYRALIRGGGLRRQMKLGWPLIEVPTLMLWGEEDKFLAKYTTYDTDRYVRNLRLRYLPGVSHWVQQDATERCNEELREFLRSDT
ncbi:putative hydrolase or acyltransferase of alpha/beta superfamily [Terriglobus roseus DSM 18391]|uniref:Putative hydrolase or acyltransferase of alpha/beta superfamily n=1 Tax=Terriglobus roseus (strain DSM 18391 / NRRL B-41598 / KBS 63) TaxID=926566 RepID=I3ZMT5_TERRK|nr:alpha/beta hydrolase [Terriglobus roseus]AFL90553.1 putative hydrolase or acyltransferase of alpha/beta superfamily [Terriglobus roseus DSM 18391]